MGQTDYQKAIQDPYYFARKCVRTFDPKDQKNPIKRFPSDKYIEAYFKLLQQKKKIAVPKSRQMFISWSTLTYGLHSAMYGVGRHVGLVSKKETDADDLLERQKFIIENILEDDLPKEFIPKYKRTYCEINFPDNASRIMAFPAGADQLRQYAFSLLIFDEMAFWDQAKEAFSSAIPTIEGGGQVICISTAAPGFFKDLVHDEI